MLLQIKIAVGFFFTKIYLRQCCVHVLQIPEHCNEASKKYYHCQFHFFILILINVIFADLIDVEHEFSPAFSLGQWFIFLLKVDVNEIGRWIYDLDRWGGIRSSGNEKWLIMGFIFFRYFVMPWNENNLLSWY